MDKDLFNDIGMDSVKDFIDFDKLGQSLDIQQGGQSSAKEGGDDTPPPVEGSKVTIIDGDQPLANEPAGPTEEEIITNASEGKVTVIDTDHSPEKVAGDDLGGEPSNAGADSSPTILNNFASALAEEGFLPALDQDKLKDINSFDDLANALSEQMRANEFAQLNDTQRRYLQALQNGIPTEDFLQMERASEDLTKISSTDLESNETLRREILQRSYQAKGISAEKASKLVQRAFDIGEDLTDATEALSELQEDAKSRLNKEIAAREEQRKQAEIASKKQLEDLKKEIVEGKEEIIPGLNLTKQLRTKIYESMTKVVGTADNGQPLNAVLKARMENPKDFEVKLHYLFNLTDGFKDLSPLVRKAKSKAVSKFTESLNKSDSYWGAQGAPATAYSNDEEMQNTLSAAKNMLRGDGMI